MSEQNYEAKKTIVSESLPIGKNSQANALLTTQDVNVKNGVKVVNRVKKRQHLMTLQIIWVILEIKVTRKVKLATQYLRSLSVHVYHTFSKIILYLLPHSIDTLFSITWY